MRWQAQRLDTTDEAALPGLDRLDAGEGADGAGGAAIGGLIRSVTTPDFAGVTFHEVAAKSALNKVPAASALPFRWTVNPWRGCTHACFYCYARGSHSWLDLGSGTDFDTQIVVKTNVADVLRRELARPSWAREPVALGTNTDPYQRAEGRYRLMPGIIEALAGSGTPFSILTKGTLLRRDLALLAGAARQVQVGIGVSLAIGDHALHESLEPGTPSPRARLDLVSTVREHGLDCGVMVAPVLPWLTDSAEAVAALLGRLAAAGATGVTAVPLHLRPGAREWYFGWLRRHRPDLVEGYERLYAHGAYADPGYRRALHRRLEPLLAEHGFGRAATRGTTTPTPDTATATATADAGAPTLF